MSNKKEGDGLNPVPHVTTTERKAGVIQGNNPELPKKGPYSGGDYLTGFPSSDDPSDTGSYPIETGGDPIDGGPGNSPGGDNPTKPQKYNE
jgi:hypothetical protein